MDLSCGTNVATLRNIVSMLSSIQPTSHPSGGSYFLAIRGHDPSQSFDGDSLASNQSTSIERRPPKNRTQYTNRQNITWLRAQEEQALETRTPACHVEKVFNETPPTSKPMHILSIVHRSVDVALAYLSQSMCLCRNTRADSAPTRRLKH